jgi:hypothetical protein
MFTVLGAETAQTGLTDMPAKTNFQQKKMIEQQRWQQQQRMEGILKTAGFQLLQKHQQKHKC